MFRILTGLGALFLAPTMALGASASDANIVQTMIANDTLLQRATRSYDTVTIRKLIPADFTLIASNGHVYSAQDFIADVADKTVTWMNNDTEDINVRPYGPDCAIVTAVLHQRFEQAGKVHDYRVRFTDTWVRLDGQWRYVAGHASLLKS